MNPWRLHTKTTLLVAATMLAMFLATLLLVSLRMVNLIREDEKELTRLLALGVAEQISLMASPRSDEDLTRAIVQTRLARPKVVAIRLWRIGGSGEAGELAITVGENGIEDMASVVGPIFRQMASAVRVSPGIGSLRDYAIEKSPQVQYHVFAPVTERGETIGLVEVVERLDNVPSVVTSYAQTALLLVLIAIGLTMGAIYLLFRHLVYRPMSQLEEAIGRVKEGSFEVEIPITSPDEFGQLASGFNRMVERIRDLTRERDVQQETLRLRVSEATAELEAEITERKRAESESSLAAARYRVIFESTPLPMWVYDPQTLNFLTVNEAAVQAYGWSREEFAQLRLVDLYPLKDVAAMLGKEARSAGLAGGAGTQASSVIGDRREWRHRRKDGTMIDVEVFSHALIYEGRRARLVIASDITEKKRAEVGMLRAQRLQSLGTLASAIAHDLNNILSPLTLSTYLLRPKIPDPEGLATLDTMEEVMERAGQLVKQVLSYARGVEGERVAIDARTIVREVVDILKQTFPRSIELETRIAERVSMVRANATQLHQVLMNLCVNARDAMPNGGRLTISLEEESLDTSATQLMPGTPPGRYLIVSVRDSGMGIEPRIIEQIFDPFFTTKDQGKGTGLGLSTSLGIVRSHGGSIGVESSPGAGSVFRVFLPVIRESEVASRAKETPEPPGGKGETVLLVDDEEPIRRLASGTLGAFGYQVLVASNGTEAVAILQARRGEIRAVITDMMMPGMDGAELISTVRTSDPDLPIVASSGLADSGREEQVRRLGAGEFLSKPYTSARLLWTLRRALEKKGSEVAGNERDDKANPDCR